MIEIKSILEVIKKADLVDNINDFDINKTFKENGIDSLDMMSLLLEFEETFKMKFSEEDFDKIHTVKDLEFILNKLK